MNGPGNMFSTGPAIRAYYATRRANIRVPRQARGEIGCKSLADIPTPPLPLNRPRHSRLSESSESSKCAIRSRTSARMLERFSFTHLTVWQQRSPITTVRTDGRLLEFPRCQCTTIEGSNRVLFTTPHLAHPRHLSSPHQRLFSLL